MKYKASYFVAETGTTIVLFCLLFHNDLLQYLQLIIYLLPAEGHRSLNFDLPLLGFFFKNIFMSCILSRILLNYVLSQIKVIIMTAF